MRDTTTKPRIACDDRLSPGSVLKATDMAEQDAPKSRPPMCHQLRVHQSRPCRLPWYNFT